MRTLALLFGLLLLAIPAFAQDAPLISGAAGFFTSTNGGKTTYIPAISPLLAAPIGKYVLVESRANLYEFFTPKGNGQSGFDTSNFIALSYLSLDIIASRHATFVLGSYLTPFGTFNERLSPIWISNFQDGPLILPIGNMTDTGTGGMLRGNAFNNGKVSVDYAAYLSVASSNLQFQSERSSGGRADLFFPKLGLEVGTSYGRLLQGNQSNAFGTHLWWQPVGTSFRVRSEYAHGAHSQGYWVETDYRTDRFGGLESPIGRLQPVFRFQQVFRNAPDPTDGLPAANTQRGDFGLDYNFPHEIRVRTSYSRRFSGTGNRNIWETSLTYRFLFPTWRGK